jgi:type II secretory pathway pseudopilin PulG
MNRGGNVQSTRGFTVVETLIVLAVTSGLFILTAVAINGKQQKTEFQVGIRNLQQQFQQVITEAASGYYPSNGSFQCTVGIGTNLQITGGSNEQGGNGACVFIGKTLIVGGAQHLDNYSTYSLAGRRTQPGGTETANPTQAKVTAIARSAANPSNSFTDTLNNVRIPNGLTFVQARRTGGVWSSSEFALSFMSSFANFESTNGVSGGSQRLELRGFSNWSTGTPDADAINRETTIIPNFPLLSQGAEMCFRSNGTNQSALIAITEGMAVTYKIKSGVVCA